MSQRPFTLVCFAMKEEARAFRARSGARRAVRILVTGIGPRNAEKAIRTALAEAEPELVLSCGFAGGLDPGLAMGTVIFAADSATSLERALLAAGARPARFHMAQQVAATAEQKRALRQTTGADAVEMESRITCAVCREQNVPCATVRVILDTANEDLPLDFNQLMTARQNLHFGKLAGALLRSPGKIRPLLRLRRQTFAAAEKLAQVLARITSG